MAGEAPEDAALAVRAARASLGRLARAACTQRGARRSCAARRVSLAR
jgi:hypothetical protein